MAKKAKKVEKNGTKKVVKKTSTKTTSLNKTKKIDNDSKKPSKKIKIKNSTPVETKTQSNSSSSPVLRAVQGSTKTYLNATELEHFRQILMDKLRQLTGDVDSIESEALRKNRADDTGNLSSMPIHMADIGSDTYEQDFALGLMSSERKIVTEIVAALKRINEGTYGICEGTGRPIPKTRLEANPWARYCVEYATKLEKGLGGYREEKKRWTKGREDDDFEKEDESEEDPLEEEPDIEIDEEAKEFDVLETDPDLEDLYEIDETKEPDVE